MKIIQVEPFVAVQNLERPFYFSQWSYSRRMVCLVRITASDGTYGWGEAYGPAPIVAAAIKHLIPDIIGANPLREAALHAHLSRRTLDYSRAGILCSAISAIDIALHDLKGKILGLPVSELMGGRRREKVRVYATGLYFTEDQPGEAPLVERLVAEARGYVADGFNAIKMKVGQGIIQDTLHVRAVREAIGSAIDLMIDANHAYDLKEARQLCDNLSDQGLSWFEEPLSPEDYRGYSDLRKTTSIAIASGECEFWAHGFHRLFSANAVDLAQPDLCAAGGLTESRRIAALATVHGINLAPHCWGTGIAFAAALHFCATLDSFPGRLFSREPILEMDRSENPLRDRLTLPTFSAEKSSVAVPSIAGLGVDVESQVLAEFAQTF